MLQHNLNNNNDNKIIQFEYIFGFFFGFSLVHFKKFFLKKADSIVCCRLLFWVACFFLFLFVCRFCRLFVCLLFIYLFVCCPFVRSFVCLFVFVRLLGV